MNGMKFPQVQPYSPESHSPGLEVLILGGASDSDGLLDDEKAKAFGICVSRESLESDVAETIESVRPHVLLIDSNVAQKPQTTLNVLRDVRRRFRAMKSILLTNESDMEFSVTAVQHGARGLIIGDRPATVEMAACIRSVHQGHVWIPNEVLVEVLNAFSKVIPMPAPRQVTPLLSPREQEVRELVVQGMTNREIAAVLRVTENTVKKYVYEVFNKTGASSRVELVLQALHSTSAA
jgi:two-component system, NarL family, nitrate/nitrite response regulator NarL